MKRMLTLVLSVIAIGLVTTALYVRVAPDDAARWHQMPDSVQPGDLTGGAIRVIEAGEDTLAQLDAIIRGTPRTRLLDGSVDSGMLTYVTRSAMFGFPDYTTVRAQDGELQIYGRLRYGLSDLGVNAARLDRWLEALAQRGG